MADLDRSSTIEHVAAYVSQTLEAAGIRAPLSGGAAVSIYSENEYASADLDFITSERNQVIAKALAPLGFCFQTGAKDFTHPALRFTVEFPPGPLAFGAEIEPSQDGVELSTEYGPIRIVSPTQSVKDRLSHFIHWGDRQALDQAAMVARRQEVDWSAIEAWARGEGMREAELLRLKRTVAADR